MATIAVELVVEKLAALIAGEAQLLGGVRRGVQDLRDDLESMKSFLQDAEARSETDQVVKTFVNQIRDVSYDAEDALEAFFHSVDSPSPPSRGFFRLLRFVVKLRARHRLALRIQTIKATVNAISARRAAFDFRLDGDAPTPSYDPRLASLYLDDSEVVGIENPKSLLISWLVEGGLGLRSVSVVGMGGLGKTTLVKKAFDSEAVKRHFSCQAWVTVSKSFTTMEILHAALKGFLQATREAVPKDVESMEGLQLVDFLRTHLEEKRYVIVFDDVWSLHAWESVKYALPDCNRGSRVIFTTRIADVAESMKLDTSGEVYHLQPLPEPEAWVLFCAKAFRGNQEPKGVCPQFLEAMSLSILKKCGGLPLAIVAIASLLSRKNNSALEWKKVHDNLASEMKSDTKLVGLERILLLSYCDLPYNLKPCYLYLSIFPEDYLIKRTKVVRLWVAERFVEEKLGLTLEEVAQLYLNELVNRSMVQVVHLDYFNRVKTFRVHDLMREIIQWKSRDELLISVVDERRITPNEKVRRISMQDSCDIRAPFLRSLLVFMPSGSSMCLGNSLFCGVRFLRVLELESAPRLFEFPPGLDELIHLRYLSLRRTMLSRIPESIGKLKNLEILDLKGTLIKSMPRGILQLKNLCQLRCYSYCHGSSLFANMYGMTVPKGVGNLTSLQKLGSVDLNDESGIVSELGKMTQLKRLGILNLKSKDGLDFSYSLEKLKHLTSLYLVSVCTDGFQIDPEISPPQFLQNLYLKCSIKTLPGWITSLHYLGKLVLQFCSLNDDPLNALVGLPNLTLFEIRQAYDGEELCCKARGYPRLKMLGLFDLKGLKNVEVVEGAMPWLSRLDIASCHNLENVPIGIEHLQNLHDLFLWDMSIYESIKRSSGEDFWKVQHIGNIKCMFERGGRWVVKSL